ncbi:protein FAR1-RELATED SEQUENCE 3 [Sesamum angolense]|uniref:Protein FAR1-RELATED SEQUENCE 3 n=1 Tax=Sesamum angolense TaxID=2727404 RepID=A0AAE2C449_9LAMI|nr:protein FAR1-RELATED SEQUENCE 3 [Sesamum angolense]
MTPLLWPRQDEIVRRFNLNDASVPGQPNSNSNVPRVGPVSLKRDVGHTDNMVVLPCLKSMTWVMENKNSTPADRVAVINLKLQDYARAPAGESEVKFSLSSVTLEPMLRSMAYISEQLSTPANKVAVINLKLQDTETTSGESEVKFQVSRDTLGAMLRSMAYIRSSCQIHNLGYLLTIVIYSNKLQLICYWSQEFNIYGTGIEAKFFSYPKISVEPRQDNPTKRLRK